MIIEDKINIVKDILEDKPFAPKEDKEEFIITKEENMIYGKVLHIDGDYKYLNKCIQV